MTSSPLRRIADMDRLEAPAMTQTDVTMIGLGRMGSALARTLLQNGYSVTVWNRSPGKADALVADGAHLAASVEEAIAASPATITNVTTHDTTIELLTPVAAGLEGRAQ